MTSATSSATSSALERWRRPKVVSCVVWSTIVLDACMGLPICIMMASFKTVYPSGAMPSLLLDLLALAVLISKTMVLSFLYLDYLDRPDGYARASVAQQQQIRRLFRYVSGMSAIVLGLQACSASSLLSSADGSTFAHALGVLFVVSAVLALPLYAMLALVFCAQGQGQRRFRPPAAVVAQAPKPSRAQHICLEVSAALRCDSEQLCCICLSHPAAGEVVTRLPCGHEFHTKCVLPWLALHSHCPFRCQSWSSAEVFM